MRTSCNTIVHARYRAVKYGSTGDRRIRGISAPLSLDYSILLLLHRRAKNSRGRDYDYARLDISDREDFRLDFISRARPLSFLRAVQLLFSLSLSLCWLLRTFRFVVEEKVSRIRREEWWRGVVFARIAVDARERKSSEGKARCFITTLRRDVSVALGWDACVHARHCKITASKTITLQANSSRASPGQ